MYIIYIILTNARPRYKSQYRIEQNHSCVRFHLANQVNVTVGGYVLHNYQLPPLFCCPTHNYSKASGPDEDCSCTYFYISSIRLQPRLPYEKRKH